jgi:hypothetical protein
VSDIEEDAPCTRGADGRVDAPALDDAVRLTAVAVGSRRPWPAWRPLADLEGRVVGLNIARASLVGVYAVPSEAIRPLLADLMSGKLAPKDDGSVRYPATELSR